ncbi:regucalcin [Coprinopsis sp. MPI-PUGE-AT-0042]|nr:regucalcin [Coprinopsis sp. MPI-PUGE-AT-0042]
MTTRRELHLDKPWLTVGCTLGEGPIYEAARSTLHFVDINENKVYHVLAETGEVTVEAFDEAVTCLVLRKDGKGLACVAAQGFALLEGNSTLSYLAQPLAADEVAHTRFNDGACDAAGRFFAGTIASPEHGIPGRLYRYDPADSTCVMIDEPFTDSNGLGWSSDGKTMYFTDSLVNKIYAYDYDVSTGKASGRRLWVDAVALGFAPNSFCDGLTLDEDGYIWSARWGGSRIVRFAPDGSVDFELMIPKALNVTACCFGGDNNDQLFVTTAHCGANGGDASRQEQYPDSGHVFRVDFSGRFKGLKRHEFPL